MLRLTVFIVAVLLCLLATSSARAAGPHDKCNFTAATELCAALIPQSRCEYFKCLVNHCPTHAALDIARKWCGTPNKPNPDMNKPLVAGGVVAMMRNAKLHEANRDGSDLKNGRASISNSKNIEILMNPENEEGAHVRRVLEAKREIHGVSGAELPAPASPCYGEIKDWSKTAAQQYLHSAAWAGYLDHAAEHYTENSPARWSGIDKGICPEPGNKAPPTSDCSSFVTWIYWTLFGKGGDFLNGESWQAGYTGTLVTHGRNVDLNALEVGDLCFYYTPMHHVAIYVGGGMVVSHGFDPVSYLKLHYAPLDYCRRYL